MNVISFVTFILFIGGCAGSKYSEEKNRKMSDFTSEDRPYRMQKVNLLWEKAKKRLSGSKLADLYADLLVQDKHEAALKKYRTEGMDKDGLKEAQVNAGFREIIEKHGLDDLFDTTGNLSNELPLDEEKKVYFSDQKLQSMWKRAEQAGFSARDLEKLRDEFWHQQMKVDEMNFLRKEMDVEDITDNEIEGSKKTGKSAEQLKQLNQETKKKNKDIKAGYYDLEGKFDKFDKEEPEFKDSRVYQLWAVAQKTDWPAEELQSFKEELKHFETRLEKHEFLENQLERSADSLSEAGENANHEKHRKLEEKTSDLGYKIAEAPEAAFEPLMDKFEQLIMLAGAESLAEYDKKQELVQTLCHYLGVERQLPAVHQFRNGLKALGVLTMAEKCPGLMKWAFVPKEEPVTADQVKKLHNDLKTRVGKAFSGHLEL